MRIPFNGNYKITQEFGDNPAYYAQFGLKGHNGIDYGLPLNTPVIASEDGTATVNYDPELGHYVQIMGAYKTLYCHLTKATISNGLVKAGQQVGLSGNSGNSTGPHLHFGVKPIPQDNNNGYGGAIDPEPLFKEEEMDPKAYANRGDIINRCRADGFEPDETYIAAWAGQFWHDFEYDWLKQPVREESLKKKYGIPNDSFLPTGAGDLYLKVKG